MVVSRYVFKAVSGVLGDSGDKDRNARFDNSAVLDGILGADTKLTDTAESGKVCGPPATKKRRVSVTGKGNTHIAHADILVMLASCMEDTTESRSDRYAIKVLRICNGTIVDRILGSGKPLVTHPPSLVTHVFDLANALVNRGSAVLGLQKQNGSSSQKSVANVVDSAEYIGGLFACIRDIVPLVRVDLARQRMDGLSDEITSQLLESTIPNLRVDIGSTDNGDSVNISMINNIGVDCSSTTYSRTVACTLRLFIALSVFGILGHDSKATLEYGLVWDSESGGTDTGAQKFFDQCKVLKQLLSEQDFRIMAFSSLKIMSAVVGVRSSLYTSDASKLRLPNVYHRDHSPRSNEALMHLAMNIGLGRLLLEPVFITHCVECIRNGQLVESSKMLCAAQIWLDMIGNIVRHSLFRSYLRISASNKVKSGQANEAGPALPFLLWWQLALAASVRCLIDMLPVDTNSDKSTAGHTRLLYLLPSHLMSWYMYLPSSDREIKQFTNLHPSALTTLTVNLDGTTAATCASKSDTDRLYQWLLSFPQPEKSSSMIYIVYFLAAKLWLCAPELQISDVTETALRASRDVWGLASDSLQLLARLLQRSAMHRDFLDLGLVDDFASVLQILVTRKQLPRLVESLVLRPLDERHSDLITIPLADTDDFGELENTHELSYLGGEDDLVGKLLHDSLQLQKSTIKTRLDVDYHSESAMAQLWDTYIGGLLRLPVTIVFRAATSNIFNGGATATALHPSDSSKNSNSRKLPTQNIQVDILDCMRDRDDVLFKVFMPLLGAKHSLSEPSVMWEDIGVAFPVDLIVLALRAADKSIIARVCTSAAFVFPIMSTSKNCTSNAGNIAAELALVLVNQLIRGGDEYDRCGTALLFFSWKQLATLVARTSECASELMTEIVQMAKDLGKFLSVEMSTSDVHTLQTSCGTPPAIIGSNEQVCGNDGASSLLYLNGRDRSDPQPPIVASKALLAYQSPVFATMFGSDFAEGHALQNNQAPCITLKCAHQTLQALVDIHNRFALLLYPTPDAQWDGEVPALVSAFLMEVDQKYSPDELAAVLEHAIFYMQTPVVLLLLHLFITKIGSKCVFTDNVLSVLGLALSEACCGSCFMDSESVALAVRRSLSAMMLLYSDRFELQGTIGEFSDRFIEDVSFLFQS
ncbi:hypothetical protein GGI07_002609 [Coemansia sp. Benny D115]|nr:hypothetical protein GGI07_002609 [Coemansia sp. Benny D115]